MEKFYKTILSKTVILLAVALMHTTLLNSQRLASTESFRVERGERPPIDLQTMPSDAYEAGVLLIRFKPEFTEHLENNPAVQLDNGAIRFNIATVDNLKDLFGAQSVKQEFLSGAFNYAFTARHKAWGFHPWY
ncbi:MAG TPA: hypothetical protein ENN08_03755, partial [Bacteroidales bacterium]|nr:hypothetical protein [Bacteroidales bacterium]